MSGTSSDDVWAVGNSQVKVIVEHWDGTEWSVVPPAQPPATLTDVVAITPTDAWAVGYGYGNALEHWDGTEWTRAPAPKPFGYIYGADASSSSDVWAVGDFTDEGGIHPLALHWDGVRWRTVPAPDGTLHSTNAFYDISVVSPTDAWAVGYQDTTGGAYFQPLIEHWDGTAWSVVASPPIPDDNSQMVAVSALSTTQVWAVGLGALIEYWDGTAWTVQDPAPKPAGFADVAAVSSTEVWTVGQWGEDLDYFPSTERFNGRKWSFVSAPFLGTDAALTAVAALASDDLWAVGGYLDNQGLKPMTLHSNGQCQELPVEQSD